MSRIKKWVRHPVFWIEMILILVIVVVAVQQLTAPEFRVVDQGSTGFVEARIFDRNGDPVKDAILRAKLIKTSPHLFEFGPSRELLYGSLSSDNGTIHKQLSPGVWEIWATLEKSRPYGYVRYPSDRIWVVVRAREVTDGITLTIKSFPPD